MTKYYLHVTDGERTYFDTSGMSLANGDAAIAFARVIANDLAGEVEYERFYVDVWDEHDKNVGRVYVVERH